MSSIIVIRVYNYGSRKSWAKPILELITDIIVPQSLPSIPLIIRNGWESNHAAGLSIILMMKAAAMGEATKAAIREIQRTGDAPSPKRGALNKIYDFFLLFSGISTQSNLSRTRTEPVKTRGIFLLRK